MKGVTGFEHIAIRARDVETMVRFYTDSLGLAEMARLFTDAVLLSPESAGVFHIGLAVENMDETVADLATRGVTTTPITIGKSDGNRHAWVVDPEGNRFEMMEMSATGLQRRAVAQLRKGQPASER